MHLSKLMQIVREAWVWDAERYPGLPESWGFQPPGIDADPRSRFQRKHILLHLSAQVGRLSCVEQECDHDPRNGGGAREYDRREQVAKLLIDVLQFASVAGFTEAEMVEEMRRVLKNKNQPQDLVNDDVE